MNSDRLTSGEISEAVARECGAGSPEFADVMRLEAEVERLRAAARDLIGCYMAGSDLGDAIDRLEAAAGLRQQEGS